MTLTVKDAAHLTYLRAYADWREAYEAWLDALDDPHLDGFAVAEYAAVADQMAQLRDQAQEAMSPGSTGVDPAEYAASGGVS